MNHPPHVLPGLNASIDLRDLLENMDSWSNRSHVSLLRLDHLQMWASGNKYFKLKQTLSAAIENGVTSIISKGGMFSNHLDALASACVFFDLDLTCVIRSYKPDNEGPTIKRLRGLGAQIEYVSPDVYAAYDESIAALQFPSSLFIPEGGLSDQGITGVRELGRFVSTLDFNHVVVAGGSMCTALGLLAELNMHIQLHIVPAWKGCTVEYMEQLIVQYRIAVSGTWDLWPDEHVGGFGKWNWALYDFMANFTGNTNIPLDPVYTGKVMFALGRRLHEQAFTVHDKILVIHSGGLQGVEGYAYRFGEPWQQYMDLITRVGRS